MVSKKNQIINLHLHLYVCSVNTGKVYTKIFTVLTLKGGFEVIFIIFIFLHVRISLLDFFNRTAQFSSAK